MSVIFDIRHATAEDDAAIWRMLEPVVRAGETYALPRDMTKEAALAYWRAPGHRTFVALAGGTVAGTYYLRPNHQGGGSHVANCGYVTSQDFSRRGLAGQMCQHSLDEARRQGFTAMQFNLVVSSNQHAVRLWTKLGFATVGVLPNAFRHPQLGLVDALVMYREL